VPGVDRQLAHQDGGARANPIGEDLQQVSAVLAGERGESPVFEHEDRGLLDPLQQPHVVTIAVRNADFLEEPR